MNEQALEIGKEYRVRYPFCRTEKTVCDEDGCTTIKCWRPGAEPYDDEYGNQQWDADGAGEMLLTLVDIHKPGKYPTRAFFVRQWRNPDGKVFGKNGLRILSVAAFKELLRGYKYHYGKAW